MLITGNSLPIAIPLTVCTSESQCQHMLSIVRTPPSTRAFQALLDNVAVGAFNFSRANGQVAPDCVLVIELVSSVAQVAVTLPHRGLAVLCRWRFKMCS